MTADAAGRSSPATGAGASETAGPRRIRIWPGRPYPLGATFDGYGTNFAVYSGVAERVELCLFDPAGPGAALAPGPAPGPGETRIDLNRGIGQIWHA